MPSVVKAAIITTAIRAAIRPYSMAVAPTSSLRTAAINLDMVCSCERGFLITNPKEDWCPSRNSDSNGGSAIVLMQISKNNLFTLLLLMLSCLLNIEIYLDKPGASSTIFFGASDA